MVRIHNKVDNEAEIAAPLFSQDNIVDITGINVSSSKIKDINADEETNY